MSQEEVDKERGVVVEEWRGGLGAGSRIRDKQFPVLFHDSRYAERLPIGKPDIIRNAPVARLRSFYDTWYRPERQAVIVVGDVDQQKIEQTVKTLFSPLTDRAAAAPIPDRKVPLHQQPLVSVVADSEVTQSNVQIVRKRPREGEPKVADYRRDLVARTIDHMMDERFSELAQKPDAKFLGAGVGNDSLSKDVSTFTMAARVQDGKLEDGLRVLAIEALRVREFGFSGTELDRAKQWMAAFYEHAYTDRDKTESGSFAQEYVSYFLNDEPSPGIVYEYQLVKQLLPTITEADASNMARSLLGDDSRVILATSPQKHGHQDSDRSGAPGRARDGDDRARDPVEGHQRHPRADGARSGGRRGRLAPRHGRRRHHRRPLRERRRGVAEADRLQERSGAVLAERPGRHLAGAAGRLPGGVAGDRAGQRGRRRRSEGARHAEGPDRQDRVGASLHRPVLAGRVRQRRAGAARDRAAAALPGIHRAGRRRGVVRAAEEAAGRGGGQPRPGAGRRSSARSSRRSTPRATTPRSR